MSSNLLHEHKMKDVLCKVRDDVANLKDEVSHLFSHKRKHSLSNRAHHLADYARDGLHAGGAFAASQLRYIRRHPGQSTAGILGGLVLLGAVGFGIYYLCKSGTEKPSRQAGRKNGDDQRKDSELPPYIS